MNNRIDTMMGWGRGVSAAGREILHAAKGGGGGSHGARERILGQAHYFLLHDTCCCGFHQPSAFARFSTHRASSPGSVTCSFTAAGNPPSLPCCFFQWSRMLYFQRHLFLCFAALALIAGEDLMRPSGFLAGHAEVDDG